MVARRWNGFQYIHERAVGPSSSRLYIPISRARSAAGWYRWATHAAKGVARRAGYAGLAFTAAEAGYHAYKHFKHRMTINESYRASHARMARNERYAGRKRRRTDVAATGGGGNPSVMTYHRMATGRYKSYKQKVDSLVRTTIQPQIERFQWLTNTYEAGNAFKLTHTAGGAGLTGVNYMPVYLFELNNCHNRVFAKTGKFGCPGMRLFRNAATGAYQFDSLGVRNSEDNLVQYPWWVEFAYENNENAQAHGYLDWVDIRLLIQGPRKTASRVTVQLVKFTDEDCMPPVFVTDSSSNPPTIDTVRPGVVSGSTEVYREWNNFWQAQCAPLLGNPLAFRKQAESDSKITVMKSITYSFQPRATDEDGPAGGVGDYRCVKWFNRVGHTYDFTSAKIDVNPDADEEINPQEFNGEREPTFTTSAKDRARMFLLVKAFTPTTAEATDPALEADVACSFDIALRRKWYYSDGQ